MLDMTHGAHGVGCGDLFLYSVHFIEILPPDCMYSKYIVLPILQNQQYQAHLLLLLLLLLLLTINLQIQINSSKGTPNALEHKIQDHHTGHTW